MTTLRPHESAFRVWQPWIIVVVVTAVAVGWGVAIYNLNVSRVNAATVADLRNQNGVLAIRLAAVNQAVQEREEALHRREIAVKQREDAINQQQAATTVTDGVWTVGVDLQPGTYQATHESTGCSWAIFSDPAGQHLVARGSLPTMTVSGGQYFRSRHCGSWTKV